MANDIALPDAFATFGANAGALAKLDPNWNTDKPEFADGIRRGFGVVSIKGKVFRIVYQGVSRPVLRPNTNEAAGSIDVVFVRAAPGLSKVFYKDGYVEGNQDAPDCFSHDGVKPDRSVQAPQASACAICPNNVWGSKMTEQGKPTKACADSKRIAIAPGPHSGIEPNSDEALDAIANEMFGGTMLLRVPAASLADLAAYESRMLAAGYPLHAVLTRISFDIEAAFPKLILSPVRPLMEDEFGEVMAHRDSQQAKDMLTSAAGDAAFQNDPAPTNAGPAVVAPTAEQIKAQNEASQAAAHKAQQEAAAEAKRVADAQAAAALKAQQEAQAAAQAAQAAAQAAPATAAAPRRARRGAAAQAAASTPATAPAATQAPVESAPTQAAPITQAPQAGATAVPDLDNALDAILGG